MTQEIDAAAIRLLDFGRQRWRPVQQLLNARLGRQFPKEKRKRVLLIHMDDRLAWPQFYPFYHFADRFAEQGFAFRSVPYPALQAEHLVKEADAIFMQAPYHVEQGELTALLERLTIDNPDAPITYFDWFAPTDVRFADQVADHVAFYAKKGLERDRSYYARPQRSHTALGDYYADMFDLHPDRPTWEHRPDIVDRLVLAPAFATSPTLLPAFERHAEPLRGDRPIDLHARFAIAPAALHEQGRVDAGRHSHWYAVMRKHAREAIAGLADKYRIAWQGRVPNSKFMAELEQSMLCFSPYGFGELCWRDLEAVLAGAVLIKPSMTHLDCLYGIYRPGETYVPVRRDLADLDETVARLLADPEECRAIAQRALAAMRAYLAGPRLTMLLDTLVSAHAYRKPLPKPVDKPQILVAGRAKAVDSFADSR